MKNNQQIEAQMTKEQDTKRQKTKGIYIGLMSGTSLDGIDASIIDTDGKDYFKSLANYHVSYTPKFQQSLKNLLNTYTNFLQIENEFSKLHAEALNSVLKQSKIAPNDVIACGFHGQTVFHNPKQQISWQIGNPHIIYANTNIKVVYDFRRKDIAFGGQGAPLIPIFHNCLAKDFLKPCAIVNIGGVANITYIDEDTLVAFDTGPGNALIDDAMHKLFNNNYDENGKIASSGKVNMQAINAFMKDDFFALNYPKSLDRNHFSQIVARINSLSKRDIIATLTYFTAQSIFRSLQLLPNMPKHIYVCGGGVKNRCLMNYLQTLVSKSNITISDISMVPNLNSDFVESQGFAYLAARFMNNLPSSFPTTTGVSKPIICGVLAK